MCGAYYYPNYYTVDDLTEIQNCENFNYVRHGMHAFFSSAQSKVSDHCRRTMRLFHTNVFANSLPAEILKLAYESSRTKVTTKPCPLKYKRRPLLPVQSSGSGSGSHARDVGTTKRNWRILPVRCDLVSATHQNRSRFRHCRADIVMIIKECNQVFRLLSRWLYFF